MRQLVDFLFTGVAVIPTTLLLAGRPDLAMMVFCPLLIVACFTAVWSGDYPARDRAERLRTTVRPGRRQTSKP